MALERYEQAIPALQRSIELRPTDPSPYYLLARVYQKLGKTEMAREQFERVKYLETANANMTSLDRFSPEILCRSDACNVSHQSPRQTNQHGEQWRDSLPATAEAYTARTALSVPIAPPLPSIVPARTIFRGAIEAATSGRSVWFNTAGDIVRERILLALLFAPDSETMLSLRQDINP